MVNIMDEDFDVIKWRQENPMDYLKAMEIINYSSDSQQKNIAFNAIYRITRLHIPDILYKFYSFTDDKQLNIAKFDTLKQQKIYMSDVKYLNDPFDNKAYFYNPKRLKYIERLNRRGGKLIDDFSTYVKVSSLTMNDYTSMPMWAHYANNHNGFCISYDMKLKENTQLSSCTFPVQYTDRRIDITDFMEQQALFITSEIEKQSSKGKKEIVFDDLSMIFMESFFCNIKHKTWEYEKEFRCTTGAIAKGMPYVSAIPKEIYIGLNCINENIINILEIAKIINIPVYRMVFNELSTTFSLLIEQL